jgi:uncharacterized membrane protein
MGVGSFDYYPRLPWTGEHHVMRDSTNSHPHSRVGWYAFRAIASVCLFYSGLGAGAAEFIRLGYLHELTGSWSRALAISDDGSVVIGTTPISDAAFKVPFRWTRETGMVALDNVQSLGDPLMSADGSLIAWEAQNTQTLPSRARILTEDFGRFDFDFRFVPDGVVGWHDETISDDGSVLVGNAQPFSLSPPGSPQGVARWTPQGGIQTLGNSPGATDGISSQLLSGDGSVIAGIRRILSTRFDRLPFRWSAGDGMTSLGEVSGHNYYEITGLSKDGSVISGISATVPEGAFIEDASATSLWRWTNETGLVVLNEGTTELNFVEQPTRVGQWLSADGSVLVGERRSPDEGQAEAYRWTEETGFQLIPTLPGRPFASVRDMTPDGKWIMGQSWANPGDELAPYTLTRQVPWLWSQETGTLNLLDVFKGQGLGPNIEGWESLWRGGANWGRISANGRAILGTGVNPEGFVEGWVAYLDPIAIPEPPSAALGLLAVACCSLSVRSARSASSSARC